MQSFSPCEFLKAVEGAANIAAGNGDFEKSERLLDGGLKIIQRVYGVNSAYALWLIHKADICVEQNDFSKASECYIQAIEILRSSLCPNHLALGIAERNLAEILQLSGCGCDSSERGKVASEIFDLYKVRGKAS